MRVNANSRIQWFHEEVIRGSFPNAVRLSERFRISVRQAQRDIDYLKKQLGAPLDFDRPHNGFIYKEPFSMPLAVTSENDDVFSRMAVNPYAAHISGGDILEADSVIIQNQIPYTAVLFISDKLTVLEMRSYIISEESKGNFLCEFHNIERFLCAILTARSGIRIVEPVWLREKLILMAQKALDNNREEDSI